MISAPWLATLLIIVLCLWYILFERKKWKNSPPGPFRIPILGNIFQVELLAHLSFCKWADKYGPIIRVDLATTKTVVISDYKMVKELFNDPASSGRMDFSMFDFVANGRLHGIVNTEGQDWEELRRFTLRQLRDFGFGKNTMEESIMLEVNELIELLKEVENKPVENIKDRLTFAVINSVWSMCTGHRYKHNDEAILEMTERALKTFDSVMEKGPLLLFAPFLGKIFPVLSGYTMVRESVDGFADYFRKPVNQHLKTFSPDFDRDFSDAFIKEIKKTTNTESAFYGKLGEDNLLATLGDLYFAGTDTTSTTLSWMILYLSKMPEIQKKLQDEIESITGNTKLVSISDRANMPYTEALIAETLRFSSITPSGVQHKALKDIKFRGYTIPKDTVITSNLYYIHHDPKVWGDPENFRPERFLSPDGKVFKKHEALLPFSTGRRQCIGESLARDSLFLFATNIFQRFWVKFDGNGPQNGFDSKASFTFIITPKPYSVFFKDRLA